MNAYQSLEQLENDLEYARNNPDDEAFFATMVERYTNAEKSIQLTLKAALYDRMLEHNPIYMIERIAADDPTKIIHCNTEQDPFFHT